MTVDFLLSIHSKCFFIVCTFYESAMWFKNSIRFSTFNTEASLFNLLIYSIEYHTLPHVPIAHSIWQELAIVLYHSIPILISFHVPAPHFIVFRSDHDDNFIVCFCVLLEQPFNRSILTKLFMLINPKWKRWWFDPWYVMSIWNLKWMYVWFFFQHGLVRLLFNFERSCTLLNDSDHKLIMLYIHVIK